MRSVNITLCIFLLLISVGCSGKSSVPQDSGVSFGNPPVPTEVTFKGKIYKSIGEVSKDLIGEEIGTATYQLNPPQKITAYSEKNKSDNNSIILIIGKVNEKYELKN